MHRHKSFYYKSIAYPLVFALAAVGCAQTLKQRDVSREVLNNLTRQSQGFRLIYNKNEELAKAFAQIDRVKDGINEQEELGLRRIWDYIKDIDFSSKDKLDEISSKEICPAISDYQVLVKWSSDGSYSSGSITIIDNSNNLILKKVTPESFEDGDYIAFINAPFNDKTSNAMIKINSTTSKKDEDAVKIIFSASAYHILRVGPVYMLGDEHEIKYLSSVKHIDGLADDVTLTDIAKEKAVYLDEMLEKGNEPLNDFFLYAMRTPSDKLLVEEYIKDVVQRRNTLIDRIGKEYSPRLAEELKKVPEVINGYNWSIVEALEDILSLKEISTPKNMKNLSGYFEVGLPEYREFCTTVRSLVWLAEKDEFSKSNNPLDYSGLKIFKKAFKKSVIGEEILKDFDKVTDILNSPTLVSFYIQRNILYSRGRINILSPYQVFKYKTGHCHEQSLFAAYCLERAGYDAVLVRAWSPVWTLGHTVVAYHDDGKLYKLDTSRGLGIVGPFKSYAEIAEEMARSEVTGGLNITVLPWKAYASRPINR